MLISVETDSMNNFINRGFFFKLLIGLTFHFFFVNSMGKNREGVMVMKIISKLCFESINFTSVVCDIQERVMYQNNNSLS